MAPKTVGNEHDREIVRFVEAHEAIKAIENGKRTVLDTETEIEGHRYEYREAFRTAFLDDEITSIEEVADPEDDHTVRVTTERFEAKGKRSERAGDEGKVVFVTVQHPKTGLSYNEVAGECAERLNHALGEAEAEEK